MVILTANPKLQTIHLETKVKTPGFVSSVAVSKPKHHQCQANLTGSGLSNQKIFRHTDTRPRSWVTLGLLPISPNPPCPTPRNQRHMYEHPGSESGEKAFPTAPLTAFAWRGAQLDPFHFLNIPARDLGRHQQQQKRCHLTLLSY